MKFIQKLVLGSLTALLFTNSVYAESQKTITLNVEKQISQQLETALAEISKPDLKAQLEKQLHKVQVELHTGLLVARATQELPVNRLKVVIAE